MIYLHEQHTSIFIGDRVVCNPLFADDIELMAGINNDLQDLAYQLQVLDYTQIENFDAFAFTYVICCLQADGVPSTTVTLHRQHSVTYRIRHHRLPISTNSKNQRYAHR